jgi:predicted RNase H-like nuclease
MCLGACDDRPVRVAGLDVWKTRWVVAVIEDGQFAGAGVGDDAQSAVDSVPDARVVAIDIPIGLPRLCCTRGADIQARKLVGPRKASSVFPAPAREFVRAPTFEAANAIARRAGCAGVSRQTYALRTAILQVAPLAAADDRIHEAHPEVSFRLAKGSCLVTSKLSWAGVHERRRLLEAQGLPIRDDVGGAGAAGIADVLDAVACAWSAWRIATGVAMRLPGEGDGRAPAIWG